LSSEAFLLDSSSSMRLRTFGILFLISSTCFQAAHLQRERQLQVLLAVSGCRLTVNGSIATNTGGGCSRHYVIIGTSRADGYAE
jgi:hypothetical protein